MATFPLQAHRRRTLPYRVDYYRREPRHRSKAEEAATILLGVVLFGVLAAFCLGLSL